MMSGLGGGFGSQPGSASQQKSARAGLIPDRTWNEPKARYT